MVEKWNDLKDRIGRIDTYDCNAGQVAVALQDLTEWIDKNIVEAAEG